MLLHLLLQHVGGDTTACGSPRDATVARAPTVVFGGGAAAAGCSAFHVSTSHSTPPPHSATTNGNKQGLEPSEKEGHIFLFLAISEALRIISSWMRSIDDNHTNGGHQQTWWSPPADWSQEPSGLHVGFAGRAEPRTHCPPYTQTRPAKGRRARFPLCSTQYCTGGSLISASSVTMMRAHCSSHWSSAMLLTFSYVGGGRQVEHSHHRSGRSGGGGANSHCGPPCAPTQCTHPPKNTILEKHKKNAI